MNAPNQLLKDRGRVRLATASLFFLLATVLVNAQQIYGTPGSPEATQSINGQVLPAPPLQFGGVINLNAKQSKP